MGKFPHFNTIRLQNLARTTTTPKPTLQFHKENSKNMENSNGADRDERSSSNGSVSNPTYGPLSEVVSDCVKRWFKDTLKEAKAGDINMQVLVGQMYYNDYGVPRDAQKGRICMARASRTHPLSGKSVIFVLVDHYPDPCYNDSDSDLDELKGDS